MSVVALALKEQFEWNARVARRVDSESLGVNLSANHHGAPDLQSQSRGVIDVDSRHQLHEFTDAPAFQSNQQPAASSIHDRNFAGGRFIDPGLESRTKVVSLSAGPMAPSPMTTRGWSTEYLVQRGPRMQPIPRVSAVNDTERLYELIKEYEASGVPLIIEGWEKTPSWPGDRLFGVDWLLEHADEMIAVRDCVTLKDREIPFKEFIQKSRVISEYAEKDEDGRLYGKDAICPKEWKEWLLNSAIPDVSKPGSSEDILELLPEPERVETLMCYYGVGDTFTAAHKDLCASSGHNLMCSAERGGSAFWFMTRSSDAANAASYFQTLGAELDHEAYVATPEQFAKAPFTVYVAEQRVGDFVLVPRRSCHQVVNHGGITAKLSWSRMTIEGLSVAFHHELPIYKRVCRLETYRVKLLVYRALLKYTEDLEREQQRFKANVPASAKSSHKARSKRASSGFSGTSSLTSLSSSGSSDNDCEIDLTPGHDKLIRDVRTLLSIYDKILKEEHQGKFQCGMRIRRSTTSQTSDDPVDRTSTGLTSMPIPAELYHDGLTCDFCGADIFQSFFECDRCPNPTAQGDNIIVCPGCYIEGRACGCVIMTPVQQFPMDLLLGVQNKAQRLLSFRGYGRNAVKVIALSHQTIDTVNHPGIFSASCQLLQLRIAARNKRQQSTYTCRKRDQSSHIVPTAAALNCKKCHSARCYRHILRDGYHTADALQLHLCDATHEKWHSYHRARAKAWKVESAVVREAEKTGAACDMSVGLVLHAQSYTSCRPVSNILWPGWYDGTSDSEPLKVPISVPRPTHPVDESDWTSSNESTEFSSGGCSVYRPSARIPSGLKIRLNMRSLAPRPHPDPRVPMGIPYILLNRLTSKERSKYYSDIATTVPNHPKAVRPNAFVIRTPRGLTKKPPGIPVNEAPSHQLRYREETSGVPSSGVEEVLAVEKEVREVRVGPPSRQKQITLVVPKRLRKKRGRPSLMGSAARIFASVEETRDGHDTSDAECSGTASGPVQLLRKASESSKTDLARGSTQSASAPKAKLKQSKKANASASTSITSRPDGSGDFALDDTDSADLYAETITYTSPPASRETGTIPAPPTRHVSHNIAEILRRLEKNERDIRQERQQKEEILIVMDQLEQELAEVRKDKEELQLTKEDVVRLEDENARLRRQLKDRSFVVTDPSASRNCRDTGFPETCHTPITNLLHPGHNNKSKPILHPKGEKHNLASGLVPRIPPRSRAPSQDVPGGGSGTPITPTNDTQARKRRRSPSAGSDEEYDDTSLPQIEVARREEHEHDLAQTPAEKGQLAVNDLDNGYTTPRISVNDPFLRRNNTTKHATASTNEPKRRKYDEDRRSLPSSLFPLPPHTPPPPPLRRRNDVEQDGADESRFDIEFDYDFTTANLELSMELERDAE